MDIDGRSRFLSAQSPANRRPAAAGDARYYLRKSALICGCLFVSSARSTGSVDSVPAVLKLPFVRCLRISTTARTSMYFRHRSLSLVLLTVALAAAAPAAQQTAPKVTTPEQFFGHQIGADYVLPNYTKYTEFVRKLDAESDRMIVQSIGKTAEGRDQLMAIITSPENHKNLAKYKDIARRLALAEGVTEDQARQLARDGKAV